MGGDQWGFFGTSKRSLRVLRMDFLKKANNTVGKRNQSYHSPPPCADDVTELVRERSPGGENELGGHPTHRERRPDVSNCALDLKPKLPGSSMFSVSVWRLKGSVEELRRCRRMIERSMMVPDGNRTGSVIKVSMSGSEGTRVNLFTGC